MKVTLPRSVDALIKKYWNASQTGTSSSYSTNYNLLNDILQISPADHPDSTATLDWIRNNFDLTLEGIVNGYEVMGDQESNQAIPANNDEILPTVLVTKVKVPPMIDTFIQENFNYSTPLTSVSSFITDDKYTDDDTYDNELSWINNHSMSFLSAIVNGYLVSRYFYVFIPLTQYYLSTDGNYISYARALKLDDSQKASLVFSSEAVTQLGLWSYAHDLSENSDSSLFPSTFINDNTDIDTKNYKWEKPDDGNDSNLKG